MLIKTDDACVCSNRSWKSATSFVQYLITRLSFIIVWRKRSIGRNRIRSDRRDFPGLRSGGTMTSGASWRSGEQRARPAREDEWHRAALPLQEGVVRDLMTRAQDLECPVGVWPRRTGCWIERAGALILFETRGGNLLMWEIVSVMRSVRCDKLMSPHMSASPVIPVISWASPGTCTVSQLEFWNTRCWQLLYRFTKNCVARI
jgi:hypothetical protein